MMRVPLTYLKRATSKSVSYKDCKRFISSSSSRTTASQNLSTRDLDKLNQTSIKLYRIILKSLRDSASASSGQFKGHILLQPPLNHRDYGAAQFMRAHECMHWPDQLLPYQSPSMKKEDTVLELISFFNWWMHDNNDALGNELVDEYVMDEMDPEGLANLLDKYVFVSYDDLGYACRKGFRMFLKDTELPDQAHLLEVQRFAIESMRVLQDMKELWKSTSVSVDKERGLRVIATSSCIGTTAVGHLSPGQDMKNRFSYRIRIENFNEKNDELKGEGPTYQLLGRKWKIAEDRDKVDIGDAANYDEYEEDDFEDDREVIVNAPTTGVVGHLPVLKPGDCFEYMSGCDLKTLTGTMSGSFHMAAVDEGTRSAQVGDPVDALYAPKDKLFELPVSPFRLVSKTSK